LRGADVLWPQLMCSPVVAANLFGLERARTIMEWETMQGTTLLRARTNNSKKD
jgi:hypothetical protein